MCIIKPFNICECPPAISFEELSIKPGLRTPLDTLGFPQRCCGCVPVKCAVIMICVLSFVWVTYELQSTEKFMKSLFESRGDSYYYCKLFYLLWCTCFLIACGSLMLGLIVLRYELLNVFVWSAFIFCCSYILLIFVATILIIINTGSMPNRAMIRSVIAVTWTCIFLYLLTVVNSYKLILWYKNLGL